MTINDTTAEVTVTVARYLTIGGAHVVVTRHPGDSHVAYDGSPRNCTWRCLGCGDGDGVLGLASESGAKRCASEHSAGCRATVLPPDPAAQVCAQITDAMRELGEAVGAAVLDLAGRVTGLEETLDAGLDHIRGEISDAAGALGQIAADHRPPPVRRRWALRKGGAR